MDAELMEKARAGLQGWQDGDLTALEELLDPNVKLLWWEPGEWDCHSSDDVLRLLAQRRREGVNRAEVELIDAGEVYSSRFPTRSTDRTGRTNPRP
jgi:hypothetical protein